MFESGGRKSKVLNESTLGIEDPKSGGGGLVMETRFLIKFTSVINDPSSEGGWCIAWDNELALQSVCNLNKKKKLWLSLSSFHQKSSSKTLNRWN